MDYLPVSDTEQKEMLATIGVASAEELFSVIPESARIEKLDLPAGMSEQALARKFEALAAKNLSLKDCVSFRGAGVYEHFVPALVDEILGRSEFYTAYTPYQAEASQGMLQAIFEYQSLVVALTGLDVANASLYDGATAVAEAALLAVRATGRKKILISSAVHPEYLHTVRTYLQGAHCEIVLLPLENGATSLERSAPLAGDDVAGVIIQSPNFFGTIEDLAAFRKITKPGTFLVTVVNPLSLGVLASPAETGADIVVGEGQVLGNCTGFGGCSFGFLAVKKELAWKIPGRIIGQTVDNQGRRGFVLTLQSREQHIRREKATSNICTNAALNALAGCIYLAGWGPDGIKKLGEANLQKSRYAYDRITKVPGFAPAFDSQPFFNEFAVRTTKDIAQLQKKLLSKKILGPEEPGRFFPDMKDTLLFCVTETRTKEDIDRLVELLAD